MRNQQKGQDVQKGPLMSHFRPGRIRPCGDEPYSNQGLAVRAGGANRVLVLELKELLFEPHEFEASGTGADLCRHVVS